MDPPLQAHPPRTGRSESLFGDPFANIMIALDHKNARKIVGHEMI